MLIIRTGQKILSLREKAGLTQEQFADMLFVSRELVSKWETGKRHPDNQMILKISKVFGVSPDEITDKDKSVLEELSSCIPMDCVLSPKEFTEILNSFLGTLSKTERTVFISRYYHGHNSSQSAYLLGLSEGNIRKKLMQIRHKFTDFLKESQNGNQ